MESAINQPRPDGDAEPDDADLFFGGDDDDETETEAPQAEEAAEAELSDPDPATFNPVSGQFDAPDPTPAESDGPTDPDPDGPAPIAQRIANAFEPDPTPGVPDADSPPTESAPTASPSAAPVSTEGFSEDPQTSSTDSGTDSSPTLDSTEPGKTSGALEREYRVFHKLQLTEKALKFLLAELDEGRAPEPRVVYMQVHKTMARNVNGAITEAYTKHKKTVGDKTDLAAVSSRAFQERHVEPKQRPETYLSIS